MSSSSNISQSTYSPSEPETPQSTQSRIQSFDQSLSHVDLGHSIEQSMKTAQNEIHQKRIQALRKELDHLKATEWEYEYEKDHDDDDDDVSKDEFLAEQILDLEITEEKNQSYNVTDIVPVNNIPTNADCFQRSGIVTYVDEKFILIDGMICFDTSRCPINISVNEKIVYLGYKDSNDSIVVVRVLENCGLFWGDNECVEENKFNVIEHVIVGEVDHRDGRFVFMQSNDLKFNLDEVQASFVPVKGDWLELKCKVQWDENKPVDITALQVLKVISVKPLRTKVKTAIVTELSSQSGICDRQIYFSKQCLQQNGSAIQIGSKVVIEAIESNQGTCTWRVIKFLSVKKDCNETPTLDITSKEDLSLELEKEKNIQVTHPLKFENIDFYETRKMNLTISNNSDQMYTINKWMILCKKRDSQIIITPVLSQPRKLYPGQTFNFTLTCQPKFLGNTKEHLIIMFRGFQIQRFIEVNVKNDNIVTDNKNKSAINGYKEGNNIEDMKNLRRNNGHAFVPGVRPIKPPAFIPVKLGSFPVPERMWSAVLGDSTQTVYSHDYENILNRIEQHFPCLCEELKLSNYINRWHTLLYMEEIQMNVNMRIYDIPKGFLIRFQEYLCIEINELSEKRPSLIIGDRAIVKDVWNTAIPHYEGYIHAIKGNLIMMKFNQQFHESYSGSDVSVEFHFTRSVLRRLHQAINLSLPNLGPDVLFPTRVISRPPQVSQETLKSIRWFNNNLNEGQKTAVSNILLGECRPMPYCIYGPPGTGKTMTVIETILQILTLLPDSRILVTTPSNSAANLITERLIQYRHQFSDSMIRLIAYYLLDSDNIPDIIKPFCATVNIATENTVKPNSHVKNGIKVKCPTSFIGRHRVTIGTCCFIGTLTQMGLPQGHFTHIIVDEAGQTTEPEIMIPLTFSDKENSQIILAGDPMQLGPITLSKYCKEYGMETSYLERILDTFPYQKDFEGFQNGYNAKLVTRLYENYRSLKEVLVLPSDMFYDGILVPKIDHNKPWILNILKTINEMFETKSENPGGIFVYGIKGCNVRSEDSPSWCNPQEASMLALTTCKLYKKNITPDEIGIISPYTAQIKYIRLLFDAMGLPQPKIGTVEEFQGQERSVILISTVRSSRLYLSEDQRYSLGFVKSEKRLNVAITRAQVAVILFCDPHLLCTDPLWHKIINYAVKEDKYMGCDLPFNCD